MSTTRAPSSLGLDAINCATCGDGTVLVGPEADHEAAAFAFRHRHDEPPPRAARKAPR